MAGNKGETIEIIVSESDAGGRLDRFLPSSVAKLGKEISRASLQGWIKDGDILLNGQKVKPRHAIAAGDRIEICIPAPTETILLPEEIEIEVLFEDEDLIVVNKAPGLVVHPGSGNDSGTLVNALLHHTGGKLCELAGEDRPGIVHRLDKDTSGCLVAAKSEVAYRSLVEQFSERRTRKEYLAVTNGQPSALQGEIRTRIGRHPVHRQRMAVVEEPAGKEAATDYEVVQCDPEGHWALLACLIHTGRTHQIRVHLREVLGCAILGDPIYAPRKKARVNVDRLMLHAWRLSLDHPRDGRRLSFDASIPAAFGPFLPSDGMGADSGAMKHEE